MRNQRYRSKRARRGAIVILVALCMTMLMAMVAFAVDYGWLTKVRADMQRAADAAALAAVQDLIPAYGTETSLLDVVSAPEAVQDVAAARATVRNYVTANLGDNSFNVAEEDIEIGRYDPSTIYSEVTLLNTGPFDTVRVTLRRDGRVNPRAMLFFAAALGILDADLQVTATAVLQKATMLGPGADVLPIAIHEDVWDGRAQGDIWSIYGDGRIEDEFGAEIPGNWGTVDIGDTSNSTSDLDDQIINGLRQDDLDVLYGDGRIDENTHIDGAESMWVQAETGFSSGMKHAVQEVQGMERMVPIYRSVTDGGGNTVEFEIVGWGVVTVVDSRWSGGNNSYLTVQKAYMYHGNLSAKANSLSNSLDSPGVISGAFTSPVLVE